VTIEPRFRLIEFENGPSYGTDHPAGWLALVDASGVELWRTWISPTPIEIWAAIGRAAGHQARLAACDHPRGFGTICDVCGGDVAALMPARLAADDFHDSVCTGTGVPAGFTCTHPSHARLAAGTEEG
jgi:hypothetical protein